MLHDNHRRICPDAIHDRHSLERIRVAWIVAGWIGVRPAAAPSTPVACLARVVLKRLRDETTAVPDRLRHRGRRHSQGPPLRRALVPPRRRSLGRIRSRARLHNRGQIVVRRPSRVRSPEGKAAPKRRAAVLRDPHRIPAEGPVAKVAESKSRNLIRKKSEEQP